MCSNLLLKTTCAGILSENFSHWQHRSNTSVRPLTMPRQKFWPKRSIRLTPIFCKTINRPPVASAASIIGAAISISLFIGRRLLLRRMRMRSEEHTSELQSRGHVVCRLLVVKNKVPEPAGHAGGVADGHGPL